VLDPEGVRHRDLRLRRGRGAADPRGYGFTADYAIERHYRDNRIYRIFEGTNEINRLIIPATVLKRIGRGALSYTAFLARSNGRSPTGRRGHRRAGPLEREHRAAEVAKRVVAYVTRVLVEKDLARSRTSSSISKCWPT